ncbi:dTDP-4-dehydrorhamnose 3,5-epimerase [Corynebacterium glucuronolyticum]|uniref:dTDP-4-dehydrorhamnose 3,5-epimerase n=2 Tax=Corynebacterium glucuronolyticum TaxID=39791 RepID=A0AAX1L988_9CORY|nr:dTDP-4-dehydrorhamnose 3,5-epimerase [Corynebacterium glucuronolyticum]EEI63603.1 dTDP-4-dehydrorhamnose 3,5-epimerase [Corynebacterium glucuronolyticum ATCC 51866]QRP71023.1 dTDP-4-dehydrorhamnose 3,5-epimerase [Corynebacterium glucuronolyticum]
MLQETNLPGVLLSVPEIHPDDRGTFHEWFKATDFEEAVGFPFDLQQANVSTSKSGVLRGLHYADVPPGQAKFVSCISGRIWDVAVDIRKGSASFGRYIGVELSAENRHSLYLPVGFAHGFVALEDSTVAYLCSEGYNPSHEHGINAFDEELGIDWPSRDVILSDKDQNAPGLREVKLPRYNECKAFEDAVRATWADA